MWRARHQALTAARALRPDTVAWITDICVPISHLADAIAQGKYPSPPARELYFVTKGKTKSKVVAEFIRWALTDGQKYVREAGYIGLAKEKLSKEAAKLK